MVWELWRLADGTPYFDTGANLATVRHADGPVGDRFAGAERLWTCRAPTPEAATLLLQRWLDSGRPTRTTSVRLNRPPPAR